MSEREIYGKAKHRRSISEKETAEVVKTEEERDVWEAKSCRTERIYNEERCLESKVVSGKRAICEKEHKSRVITARGKSM